VTTVTPSQPVSPSLSQGTTPLCVSTLHGLPGQHHLTSANLPVDAPVDSLPLIPFAFPSTWSTVPALLHMFANRSLPTYSRSLPMFDVCVSLPDMLSQCDAVADSEFIPASALAAAASDVLRGLGIPPLAISAAESILATEGLSALIAQSQNIYRPSTLQLPPSSGPHPHTITTHRFHRLVFQDNPILFPPSFVPNDGIGVPCMPQSIAPDAVVAQHFAEYLRAGRIVLLREKVLALHCARTGQHYHVNPCFLTGKPSKPMGRLVVWFKNLTDANKRLLLQAMWGSLLPPGSADLCQLLLNAIACFPDCLIICGKRDVHNAYPRVLTFPDHVPFCAVRVVISGVPHVALPLGQWFGLQESNYSFGVVTAFLLARSHARLSLICSRCISTMATDDFIMYGPPDVVRTECAFVSQDFVTFCGLGADNLSKHEQGPRLDALGLFMDCPLRTISVPARAMAKLLRVFFTLTMSNPSPGDTIPTRHLQRLGSYACLYANTVTPLLPFSRSFHRAISLTFRRSAPSQSRWTDRAVGDLWMWRIVLYLAVRDTRWLVCSITRPTLLRRLPNESLLDRAKRQASVADIVTYGDACTTSPLNGLGLVIMDVLWASHSLPPLPSYLRECGDSAEVCINILEFTAAIISLLIAVAYTLVKFPTHTMHGRPLHIHYWGDNTSCLSWLRRHRALHPYLSYLLHLQCFIQVRFNVLLTSGHCPGVDNTFADAASRDFRCPQGPALRLHMSTWTRIPISSICERLIVEPLLTPLRDPSARVRLALTNLELATGFVSATVTTWPPTALIASRSTVSQNFTSATFASGLAPPSLRPSTPTSPMLSNF
jgi:hypothetical protein